MRLFGHPLSSCTRKVLMTFAEKSASCELVTVDLFAGEHRAPAHFARQPFGRIPVLDDGGTLLFESRAIIRYLDAKLPGPALTPSSPRERALADQWMSADQSYVAPHTAALAGELVVKKHLGLPSDEKAVDTSRKSLDAAFRVFDAALASRPFLAGESLTLADISLLPYVFSLALLGEERLLDDKPALVAWRDRLGSRPSWKAVLAHRE